MRDEDIKYIHELEERVQELEELIAAYHTELSIKDNANKRIKKKNKRYRETIIDLNNLWKHVDSYDEFLNAVDEVTSRALEESE